MLAAVAEGEVCVAGATAEASYIERCNLIIFVCVNMKKKKKAHTHHIKCQSQNNPDTNQRPEAAADSPEQ